MRPAGGSILYANLPGVVGKARFSQCGEYRYVLVKKWGDGKTLVAILLNPSTATGDGDDPTVRRLVLRARAMKGYGALVVLNAYAYRATNPRQLRRVADPVGPRNDRWIARVARAADAVLIGWGDRGEPRSAQVLSILAQAGAPVFRIGDATRRGNPRHPLFLRKDTPLESVAVLAD